MSLPLVVAVLIAFVVFGLGGWMTKIGPWYENLNMPRWQPPRWLFAPAWTIILGLAAWSGALAWTQATERPDQLRIVGLFGANIAFQLLWSPLFFRMKRPDWALIEIVFLWLSIVALMIGLFPLSSAALWLLVPYLVWVTFAWFLNLKIVQLNRPFGRVY